MADGESVDTHSRKSNLLDRNRATGSYFWGQKVSRCVSEGHKLLGDKLREEEEEAKIAYHKSFSALFDGEAQIDAPFLQLIFDSEESTNLDSLFDDLATVAHNDAAKTRLLDMLFVTHQFDKLVEVQKSINAPYDLYDANAAVKLGRMTTFANLISRLPKRNASYRDSANFALLLSMLATGQEELVESSLIYMANIMHFHWDAMILSRIYYKKDHVISMKVRDAWVEAVMDNPNFRMLNVARSLKTSNRKDVARTLMTATSKSKECELILAYRCLAIFIAAGSSHLSALERKVEEADAYTLMRSIFVTMLVRGKIDWAKHCLADVAMRAPLGDIPTEICQIGMTCFVELVEMLLKTRDAPFTVMAKKWRSEMTGGQAEISKLKKENHAARKTPSQLQQQSTMQQAQPTVPPPVSAGYTSLSSEAPPPAVPSPPPPPATDPLMSAVSVMSSLDATEAAHSSQSATSVQQMGQQGQSTLPPNLSVEEGLPAAAVAQSTIMQPHPPPSLMAVVVPSNPSPSPSLDLIKLSPPESIVLPIENRENGGYQSTSTESILSPIAEASQNPLQVDVCVQPLQVESGESPFHPQTTPRIEDVCSSNSQSRYAGREDVMRQTPSQLQQQSTMQQAQPTVPPPVSAGYTSLSSEAPPPAVPSPPPPPATDPLMAVTMASEKSSNRDRTTWEEHRM